MRKGRPVYRGLMRMVPLYCRSQSTASRGAATMLRTSVGTASPTFSTLAPMTPKATKLESLLGRWSQFSAAERESEKHTFEVEVLNAARELPSRQLLSLFTQRVRPLRGTP